MSSPLDGSPASGPVALQHIYAETVSGIPDKFAVFKIVVINDGSISYIVTYIDSNNFYEVVTYATPHATWSAWLSEPDVAGFAASPTSYTPTTSQYFSFTKVSAMP